MKIIRSFILLSFLFCSATFANTLDIIGFRTSATSAKARLVFDINGKANYQVFTLQNPNRLVIDINSVHLKTDSLNQKAFKHSLIKNFRMRLNKDHLRIVMDLEKNVQTNSFILPADRSHPYRLVVDLLSEQLPAPAPNLAVKSVQSTQTIRKQAIAPAPTYVSNLSTKSNTRWRNIIIVIDPGHGGKDPGTTGPGGIHEKNVVLAIAKYLQQALNLEPGFHAILTRSGDYYIPLRGRLNIARQDKADMFVSIHADAYQNKAAMGASVFALSERGATSEAARWLAEKENSSELLGGASLPDNDNVLRSVLIDLSQTNTISESLQIGTSVLRNLDNVTVLHHPRVEQAAFVVLKSPDIPSLLVETGFLSTPKQEQQLKNPHYQQLIASAIMNGVRSYFVRNPPPGTWLAAEHSRGTRYVQNE